MVKIARSGNERASPVGYYNIVKFWKLKCPPKNGKKGEKFKKSLKDELCNSETLKIYRMSKAGKKERN